MSVEDRCIQHLYLTNFLVPPGKFRHSERSKRKDDLGPELSYKPDKIGQK